MKEIKADENGKEKLLLDYLNTGLSPDQIVFQKEQMHKIGQGCLIEIPKFKPGDMAYLVNCEYNFQYPSIFECIVTGYDWSDQEGFCLNIQSTNRDHKEKVFKSIPFSKVNNFLFGTCEEAGKKVDELMRKR